MHAIQTFNISVDVAYTEGSVREYMIVHGQGKVTVTSFIGLLVVDALLLDKTQVRPSQLVLVIQYTAVPILAMVIICKHGTIHNTRPLIAL